MPASTTASPGSGTLAGGAIPAAVAEVTVGTVVGMPPTKKRATAAGPDDAAKAGCRALSPAPHRVAKPPNV